jgi:hypothetical protein
MLALLLPSGAVLLRKHATSDTPAPDICSVLARMQQLQQRLNRAKKGNTYQHVTGRADLGGKHLAPGDSASRVAAATT